MKSGNKISPFAWSSLLVLFTIVLSAFTAYTVAESVLETKQATPMSASQHSSNKLMVHISSSPDEKHSIMMGLQKALKAREAGSQVFVFMDVKATDVALKETSIKFADFKPSQDIIADLIDKGVEVYVCPHCLMVNGNKMSEVQPGIKELTMDAMMKFSQGAAVTTLDY